MKRMTWVCGLAMAMACSGNGPSDEDAGGADANPGCTAEAGCDEADYCAWGGSCGAGEPGMCRERPEICTGDCPGVCGCDGSFYCNACVAARNGVDVDDEGSCPRPCDAQDIEITGSCLRVLGWWWNGRDCFVHGGCECTGTDCDAFFATEEACLAVYGRCRSTDPCGGVTGAMCPASDWCDYEMCGVADGIGTCRQRPEACLGFGGAFVCGCDGRTYDDDCSAHRAGTDVASDGRCDP